ncbi:hypothetical protein [Streptomyces cylindrosporus]|uniref:Minor tail protein n=1 Tax=Streptomyces cylindrosporus TaxID=2927583 RepID=A0ABS9YGF9_9ACTN|nr:hypothetical protein [Streptomyces cylindrosporus]MCI3274966.1 hypothetical protein [Streptomyces cylindrosporus]
MQQADDATAAALTAGERTVRHTTRLGGEDVSAQVQSWQLERSYATDLPAAMRAFSGSSAAQLQVQLSGTGGQSAPQLYSPWADRTTGDLARPGQSVVHEGGPGTTATLPAFRGTVRSRSAASGTDSLQVTALDGAERLRGPAVLPKPYAGFYWQRPVASATWCVSELLRQGGLYACPPPRYPDFAEGRPLTLVYATLHGGFATPYGQPEILPDPTTYTFAREGAPHELALVPKQPQVKASWFPRSRVTVPGSRMFAEVWVNNSVRYDSTSGDDGIGAGDRVIVQLELNRNGSNTGYLKLDVNFAEQWLRIASMDNSAGWTFQWTWPALVQRGVWHIGAFLDLSGGSSSVYPTVQPRLTAPDGTQLVGGAGTFTDPSALQPASELSQVTLYTDLPAECLQVTGGLAAMPTAAEFAQTWTKGVELDDVILPSTTLPRVSGSQWEVISQIAKASMSTAELDERGVFRWRNHTRFAERPAAPDLTLTSVREIASLTATEEIDACRNYCTQPYKDWTGIGAISGTTLQDDVIRVLQPGKTTTVKYLMSDEEYDISPPGTDDDTGATPGTNVRFGTSPSGGTAVKGMVDMLVRREDGYLVVRYGNRSSQTLYTVTTAGKPSFYLQTLKPGADPVDRDAIALLDDPANDPDGVASERFYGRQEYTADATDWVQDADSAAGLARAMRAAGVLPVPVIGDVDVLYDPRIQLGDAVRVVDTTGAELDTLAWVVGIRTAATAEGGVQQTLTLRGMDPGALPADSGLTPDPPSDPAPVTRATYASVTAAFPTLAALTASGLTWGEIEEGAHV